MYGTKGWRIVAAYLQLEGDDGQEELHPLHHAFPQLPTVEDEVSVCTDYDSGPESDIDSSDSWLEDIFLFGIGNEPEWVVQRQPTGEASVTGQGPCKDSRPLDHTVDRGCTTCPRCVDGSRSVPDIHNGLAKVGDQGLNIRSSATDVLYPLIYIPLQM